nr:DNA repair protein RAD4 [Tanacetum cinerariifolium]
ITPNASGVAPEQMSVDSYSRNSLDGNWGLISGGEASKGKVPGADEDDKNDCAGPGGTIDLLGSGKTEPLCLHPAENRIVPKVYAEEDVWRGAEERRKNAAQAISRWYQLILDVPKWPCSVDYDGIGWEFKKYLANLLKKPITIAYRLLDRI